MKNIKIFAAVLAVILLASCNRKVEFNHETFATFYEVGYNVNEDNGSLEIPVIIYNPTGADVQVTVKGIDGKAVQGTDYEIVEPASGILNFSGATDSLSVKVEIKDDFVGEFTGAKDFKLQIASSIGVGLLNTANINIIDLDHPLSGYIGTWSGNLISAFDGTSTPTTFTVSADDTDPSYKTLIFDNGLVPFFKANGFAPTFKGVANDDNTQVTVAAEQAVGYDDVILLGFNHADPDQATENGPAIFTLNEDGTLTLLTCYGCYTANQGGWFELYFGDATFTKK